MVHAGALQFLMKEHDKAMITYKQGLEHDPENQELKEGVENCIRAISRCAGKGRGAEEGHDRMSPSAPTAGEEGVVQTCIGAVWVHGVVLWKDTVMRKVMAELVR
eukprot:1156229-Pelagomonas_calceolata.AAC.5